MTGGIRIPLLMYADDIVMMAGSVEELRKMNRVASEYAFKNRFRHNGDKSAVMMFNPDKQTRKRVLEKVWRLSGERVQVKDKYKYLGVDIVNKIADWKTHVKRIIGKAKFRSRDLLWMCKQGQGYQAEVGSHVVEVHGSADTRVRL